MCIEHNHINWFRWANHQQRELKALSLRSVVKIRIRLVKFSHFGFVFCTELASASHSSWCKHLANDLIFFAPLPPLRPSPPSSVPLLLPSARHHRVLLLSLRLLWMCRRTTGDWARDTALCMREIAVKSSTGSASAKCISIHWLCTLCTLLFSSFLLLLFNFLPSTF